MTRSLFGLGSIAAVCAVLIFGLWPFHAPRNDVRWLPNRNGLRFGDYGTAVSSGPFHLSAGSERNSCSIEIWLKPARSSGSGTILAFHGATERLSLHQSLSDLLLKRGAEKQGIYLHHPFERRVPLFLTIVSGVHGTLFYVSGIVAQVDHRPFFDAADCTGRLILADSALQQSTWSGEILGLAVYHSELLPAAVLRHYLSWTRDGEPEISEPENNIALYRFDEHASQQVRNYAPANPDLQIPAIFTVLDKLTFEPLWQEFELSWGFCRNAVKNVIGFVPLGFLLYGYLYSSGRRRHIGLLTVTAGFAISFIIEWLQGYLPTRDSGTTDLVTNSLGTFIGARVSRMSIERAGRIHLNTRRDVARVFSYLSAMGARRGDRAAYRG